MNRRRTDVLCIIFVMIGVLLPLYMSLRITSSAFKSSLLNTHHKHNHNVHKRSFDKKHHKVSSSSLLAHLGEYDVTVLGGGPAGMTMAFLLQTQHKLNVALVDPRASNPKTWYPNYGEWKDEWNALSERLQLPELKECITNEWDVTDCYLGKTDSSSESGSESSSRASTGRETENERLRIDRAYIRVDRVKMQKLMHERFQSSHGKIIDSKVTTKISSKMKNLFTTNGIVHSSDGSHITLDDGDTLQTKVIIDATGFESRLIKKEDPRIARGNLVDLPVGYQIAYGYIANVDSLGPYDMNAMTLFDYRTNFVKDDPNWLSECEDKPTFMYVMPLARNSDGSYKVFMEETLLVGRGERRLSFTECKRRAMKRMEFHKMKLLNTLEEEYCYIPMGGDLPDLTQRVIAFGGAANMVHPSTGYQVNRMLAASTDVAQTISQGIRMKQSPDTIAALAYQTMWSNSNRLQRDFQVYGGDFFMNQNVHILRDFFTAFFTTNRDSWSGFLQGWPGLPDNHHHDSWGKRVKFAAEVFCKLSNSARGALLKHLCQHIRKYGTQTVLRSLSPPFLFGGGPEVYELYQTFNDPSGNLNDNDEEIGDVEAKAEARRMMKAFETARQEKENTGKRDFVFPSPFA